MTKLSAKNHFNPIHLEAFLRQTEHYIDQYIEQGRVGDSPRSRAMWLNANGFTLTEEFISLLPPHQLSRKELTLYAQESLNMLCVFLAVMGWGQQNRRNLRLCWPESRRLTHILNELRSKVRARTSAFDLFCERNKVPGLGPAYFTKLISFVRPDLNGYILDQFTARSVNLLLDQNIVPLIGKNVSPKATSYHYENYCLCVDQLTIILNSEMSPRNRIDGSFVEYLLFGKSDGPMEWRNYLKRNDGLG
jgi:hypothetical protein